MINAVWHTSEKKTTLACADLAEGGLIRMASFQAVLLNRDSWECVKKMELLHRNREGLAGVRAPFQAREECRDLVRGLANFRDTAASVGRAVISTKVCAVLNSSFVS